METPTKEKCVRFVCPYCGQGVDRDTRICWECKENHGVECGEMKDMLCDECHEEEEARQ